MPNSVLCGCCSSILTSLFIKCLKRAFIFRGVVKNRDMVFFGFLGGGVKNLSTKRWKRFVKKMKLKRLTVLHELQQLKAWLRDPIDHGKRTCEP